MLFIIILSIILAADSFVTCLSLGLCECGRKNQRIWLLISSISLFHFLMPIASIAFTNHFVNIDFSIGKYISATIFFILGIKMLREGEVKVNTCSIKKIISLTILKILAISLMLSIDAAAAGLSVSILNLDSSILIAPTLFAISCFILSVIGYFLGRILHNLARVYSNIIAGIIMLLLALKVTFS